MTTITRAIVMIRTGAILMMIKQWLTTKKQQTRRWFVAKLERATVSAIKWALSKHEVQRVIVKQFTTSNTPMCCALNEAVENAVSDYKSEVDADDINGLERFVDHAIENALDDLEIDAENVKQLDSAITEVVERNEDLQKELVNGAVDELCARLKSR